MLATGSRAQRRLGVRYCRVSRLPYVMAVGSAEPPGGPSGLHRQGPRQATQAPSRGSLCRRYDCVLLTGSGDNTITMFDRDGRLCNPRLVSDPELSPLGLAIAPSGNLVVSSEWPFGSPGATATIREYDPSPGRLIRVLAPDTTVKFTKPPRTAVRAWRPALLCRPGPRRCLRLPHGGVPRSDRRAAEAQRPGGPAAEVAAAGTSGAVPRQRLLPHTANEIDGVPLRRRHDQFEHRR